MAMDRASNHKILLAITSVTTTSEAILYVKVGLLKITSAYMRRGADLLFVVLRRIVCGSFANHEANIYNDTNLIYLFGIDKI